LGFRIPKFVISSEGMPLAEHVFCREISNPIILGDFSPDQKHQERNSLPAFLAGHFLKSENQFGLGI